MVNDLTKQEHRAIVATKIHVAIDQLEKACAILDMAWQESAAERSLLYCLESVQQARASMLSAELATDLLMRSYKAEEEYAARPK